MGYCLKEVNIKNAKRVRIHWGVLIYPEGANWEKGVLREVVGLVITFGRKKFPVEVISYRMFPIL